MKKILLVAGDTSADLHGANLVKELKKILPEIKISSLGGLHLSSVSDQFLYNLVELAVFGLGDSIKNYFFFRRIFQEVVLKFLDAERPDCVIPIDFYGFNIHLAREAKKRNIPVIYYISPQVWASRPGRVKKLARCIDKMIVILPFEEEIYQDAGVDTVFFGHPLLDIVPAINHQLSTINCHIGLLPGSRKSVISRHLPLLFNLAKMIKEKFPESRFFLPWTKNMPIDYLQEMVKTSPVDISLVNDENYEERKKFRIAFACSGTATLENALLGIPTIIIYKTTWFFYLVARSLVKVPYIGLVNIISGKNLFPEFIQHKIKTEKIVEKAESWLNNPQEWQKIHQELIDLRKKLGSPSRPAEEAGQPGVAKLIAEEIKKCING
jgi:lipid-A-disaccharide synthase